MGSQPYEPSPERSIPQTRARGRTTIVAAALVLLCLAVYVPPALLTPFFWKGEPREGLEVRQIVEHGQWVLPSRLGPEGMTFASKPPLFHWLAGMTARVGGGTTEWTMRVPSIALGSLGVLLVWWITGPVLGTHAALIAAATLATTYEWGRAASTARVDGVLAAFTTLALLLAYRGFVRGGLSLGEVLGFWGAVAGAALTKGPVGVAVPLLVVGTALLLGRRLHLVRELRPWLGAGLLLVLVGGWYVAAWWVGGDAFLRVVVGENLSRFLGAEFEGRSHVEPFYYYGPVMFAGFLPWSPLLVGAVLAVACRPGSRRDPRLLFPLVWLGTVLVLYSLSAGKRPPYVLAAYPAGALLVGWWFVERAADGAGGSQLGTRGVRAVTAVALAVVGTLPAIVLAHLGGLAPLRLVLPFMSPRDQRNVPVIEGILDEHAVVVLLVLGLMLATLVAARAAFDRARSDGVALSLVAFAMVLWILVFGVFQPELAHQRTLRPFLAEVARTTGEAPLYFYPETFSYSAAFYAPRPPRVWEPRRHESGPVYVLIWDTELQALAASERARLDVLATSTGTDHRGRRHLVLAAVRAGTKARRSDR